MRGISEERLRELLRVDDYGNDFIEGDEVFAACEELDVCPLARTTRRTRMKKYIYLVNFYAQGYGFSGHYERFIELNEPVNEPSKMELIDKEVSIAFDNMGSFNVKSVALMDIQELPGNQE